MSNVMTISKRTASGLEEVLRTLLLDSENKVPSERLRIVGAIAKGAVMESGSNANGYWLKLADGTLICWNLTEYILLENIDINISRAGRYESNAISLTPPYAFVSNFRVVGGVFIPAGNSMGVSADVSGNTQKQINIRLYANTVLSTRNYHVYYIAVGKWK